MRAAFDALRRAIDLREPREIQHGNTREDDAPIPMILTCPRCKASHVDRGEFATRRHHTHACQECGVVWRPAIVPTVGVQFLPGFKDDEPPKETS
jgi:hypothetical protein